MSSKDYRKSYHGGVRTVNNTTTPTKEEVRELQDALLKMNKETFDLYKKLAYVLITKTPDIKENDDDSEAIKKQRQFVQQTAGKIRVDEDAIDDLRRRSMI